MIPALKPVIKQPAETLWLPVAFPALPLGGAIVTAVVAIAARGLIAAAAPLTVAAQAIAGSSVRVEVAGGTDGESYLVTVTATANDGEIYQAEAEVRVADLAFAAPDGVLPYVSIAQVVERLGIDETIRMTDALGTGRVDKARLLAALTDAQAIADGYIAAAGFGVPLPVAPQLVTTLVLDLAIARLYGEAMPAGVATAKADALAALKDIAAGRLKLPLAAIAAATPVSPTPIFTTGPERTFTRDRLQAF